MSPPTAEPIVLSTRMPAPIRARHSSSRAARDAAASDGMIDAGWASPRAIDDRTTASASAGSAAPSRSWRPVRRSPPARSTSSRSRSNDRRLSSSSTDAAPAEQVDPVDAVARQMSPSCSRSSSSLGVGEQLVERLDRAGHRVRVGRCRRSTHRRVRAMTTRPPATSVRNAPRRAAPRRLRGRRRAARRRCRGHAGRSTMKRAPPSRSRASTSRNLGGVVAARTGADTELPGEVPEWSHLGPRARRPVAHGDETAGAHAATGRRPGSRRCGPRPTARRRRRAAGGPRLRRRPSRGRCRRPRRRRGCRARPRRRGRGRARRGRDRGRRRGSRRPGAPRRGRRPAHPIGTADRGRAAHAKDRVAGRRRAARTRTATWGSTPDESSAGPAGAARRRCAGAGAQHSRHPTRAR